jgi:hypothetical protein
VTALQHLGLIFTSYRALIQLVFHVSIAVVGLEPWVLCRCLNVLKGSKECIYYVQLVVSVSLPGDL